MTIKHYTGQMTKEELRNTRLLVLSEDHSRAFQKMCFKSGVYWDGLADGITNTNVTPMFTELAIQSNLEMEYFDSVEENESKINMLITWTPMDLSTPPKGSTHFLHNILWLKKSKTSKSGWMAINVVGDKVFRNQDSINELLPIYKISDFIHQEEKQMTTNIIQKVRDILPECAEIAIAHDKINLFIADYCFEIESIEDINKIQSALNTIEDYKA